MSNNVAQHEVYIVVFTCALYLICDRHAVLHLHESIFNCLRLRCHSPHSRTFSMDYLPYITNMIYWEDLHRVREAEVLRGITESNSNISTDSNIDSLSSDKDDNNDDDDFISEPNHHYHYRQTRSSSRNDRTANTKVHPFFVKDPICEDSHVCMGLHVDDASLLQAGIRKIRWSRMVDTE